MADELSSAGLNLGIGYGDLFERFVTDASMPRLLAEIVAAAAKTGTAHEQLMIGRSRAGREMVGLRIGSGPLHVSITAGAHSDEPVGPMTAIELAVWLASGQPDARQFTRDFTFCICAQTNPDGSALNSRWFADPLDPFNYFQNVVREAPGDDIEFGYPANGEPALRPENQAVADFLRPHGPYLFHTSLHGMAFAEGAWFLICKEWSNRTQPLQQQLARLAKSHGFPLHDIERHGEKGFTRIAPGFCTTPTSTAMRTYFLERNDATTAAQFRPSSMEFVQSLGGDPLLMVSELPLFMIMDPAQRPPDVPLQRGATAYEHFREALPAARAAAEHGNLAPAKELMEKYQLEPVPLHKQVTLQAQMILAALAFLQSRTAT
ncbi:MAG: M14 family zinc carboxypeptidase [Candidatus Sumerlaeaceae bacterium]